MHIYIFFILNRQSTFAQTGNLNSKSNILYYMKSQDILKYTERAGEDTTDLMKAVEVMRVVPKAANDMMNVGRLQGFDVSYFTVSATTIETRVELISCCWCCLFWHSVHLIFFFFFGPRFNCYLRICPVQLKLNGPWLVAGPFGVLWSF